MTGGLKLTIIGGGAFRTPRLVYGLIRHAAELNVRQIDLYDPDFSRMEALLAVSRHVAAKMGSALVFNPRRSLPEAVAGADFVFLTYRIGGEAARALDERCALDSGVLGQETVGPGGFFMALRSIPVTLDYVQRIREIAPDAWIINFTNPAGIVTEAVHQAGDSRFVGVCDTPYHLQMEIAEYLGVTTDALEVEVAGLNHLGWFTKITHQGVDMLPKLLNELPQVLQAIRPLSFFTAEEIQRFASLPTEYVYFYLHAREVVLRTQDRPSRGEIIQASMQSFFPELQQLVAQGAIDEAWRLYGQVITGRSNSYLANETGSAFPRGLNPDSLFNSEGYEGIAIRLMEGLMGEQRSRTVINVPSHGLLPEIGADAVIECACEVEHQKIKPVPLTSRVAPWCLALIKETKQFELATVKAANSRRIDDSAVALAQHPILDGDQEKAWQIVRQRSQLPEAPRWVS
ncbi:hypothetical protein [Sulfobacillus harzensis]|uniref:Glycosyl hydrolase family 4 C-terminal domain-containing protein n=1 Tax=Sulfobacillus harzensis TaxID=2729629 RepID=A0A7Y0L4P4_9FIRM|nr:hypothetical protein [Sulfobacillus harzensis]NMP22912.1 hypothetical protein [Sulfobacillus harzensis]